MKFPLPLKFVFLLGLGCTSLVGSKASDYYRDRTAQNVDLSRFMGAWYVIARIPTWFEEGAHNAVEKYTWNQEKERIDINYSHRQDAFDGKLKAYPQKGWVFDQKTNAHWKVQFFWPFKHDYLILEIDPNYNYTVVGVPNRKYLWIMSRTPEMEQGSYNDIVARLRQKGEHVEKLEMAPQSWQ